MIILLKRLILISIIRLANLYTISINLHIEVFFHNYLLKMKEFKYLDFFNLQKNFY
jgi:hypothetical protein